MLGWHGVPQALASGPPFGQMVETASEPGLHINWVPAVNNLIV